MKIAQLIRRWDCVRTVEKGNLADSDGSKDSSLESNEFRSYGRNDGTFLKEVKRNENFIFANNVVVAVTLFLCNFFA